MDCRSHTKIICTIGPKTDSVEEIARLHARGMSIARLNLSHGSLGYHSHVIDNIRAAEKMSGHRIFIALDTRGPEFRVSCRGPMKIHKGDSVRIVKGDPRSPDEIGTDVESFEFLSPGSIITFDDRKLCVAVEAISSEAALCKSLGTHLLEDNKRICFPRSPGKPFLGEEDIKGLQLGIEKDIDAVFLSFVEKAADVFLARQLLDGHNVQVVSKIESLAGVENAEAIAEASDGIMIARGDLFNSIGAETMFSTQKRMMHKCRARPIIMATEMLSNMAHEPTPLRSEIADIGHSVLDGCAGVMLSEETACGEYPSESVDVMRRVCMDAESFAGYTHECMDVNDIEELRLKRPAISLVRMENRCRARKYMLQRGVYFACP